jgi:predicted negative regulator of RcsB-dependent stress response
LSEYLTEQEQIELIKNWLKQYGFSIIVSIMLALAAMSGFRYWQNRQITHAINASSLYDDMLGARAQNNPKDLKQNADKLLKKYPATVYSQMASMMLSRDHIVNKDYDKAKLALQSVMDLSKVPAYKEIARLRYARILITEKKPKEAIKLLATVDDINFVGLSDEIKGDAYRTMHDRENARLFYAKAIKQIPNSDRLRPLLQMKYDNQMSTNNKKDL